MEVLEAVRAALVAYSDLTDLIAEAVYPITAPQGIEPPFVVMEVISANPVNSLDGSGEKASRLIQISSYGITRQTAMLVNAEVRRAMAATAVLKNLWVDERDQPFIPDLRRFGISSDFLVWHTG